MAETENVEQKSGSKKYVYPSEIEVVAVRDVVMFPQMALPLSVSRTKSVAAIEEALKKEKYVLALAQKKPSIDDPGENDLFKVGVLSKVTQSLKMPDGTMKVFLQGIRRCVVTKLDIGKEIRARVEYPEVKVKINAEIAALMRHAAEVFETYVKLSTKISMDAGTLLNQLENDPEKLSDTIAANSILDIQSRQDILETWNAKERLEKIIKYLTREVEILDIEQKIHSRVKNQIEKSQKEYYLTEQMKAIQQELHQKDDFAKEIDEFKRKIKSAKMPKYAEDAAKKELARLAKMTPFSPESTVLRTYLDWMISLPWSQETQDNLDIPKAREILEEDHYGLEKPKERVLEYLAVCKLTKKLKGPILCFVGPPGVGKTSIARSIARAMGRNFVRMSLGGVRDEAEIRGHRRTYIASMPGRIIQSMKRARSKNPVFLLDEIDKMGMDWRGDPAAALLEVLDPEQNTEFTDHFLDVPFDISKVMFIATANTVYDIPLTLRDRLEIIEFSGYTHNEKIEIAKKFLIPKQAREHGLKPEKILLGDAAITRIIRDYTREAGVRNLEREIANLSRRVARRIVENKKSSVQIAENNLKKFLGVPKYVRDELSPNGVGIVTGLAWTSAGGEILTIETISYPGKGSVIVTGKLGDIMKESAQAAFSYVKSMGYRPYSYIKSHDFHIHIPEGATPKDGPSAGITIATALASLLLEKPVKKGVAMTGEITLSGRVLPIGGLKEKAIAAYREGICEIFFPKTNCSNLEEIPREIKKNLKLIPVSSAKEVFDRVILNYREER